MNVLSGLLGVNANSIGQAIADTRQLLAEHGRLIAASTLRFATVEALMAFAPGSGPEPTRPRLAERLADSALTGMTRAELAALTERTVPVLAARAERHRHRLRGGERLPGARGGVFMQKITDAERVLATVLYRRGLSTHDTLAELFEVSRRVPRLAGRPGRKRRGHADNLILYRPTRSATFKTGCPSGYAARSARRCARPTTPTPPSTPRPS
jgi:hypothetical protein